jgi:oligopeptidase B
MKLNIAFLFSLIFLFSCSQNEPVMEKSESQLLLKQELKAPMATKIPQKLKKHDDVRLDKYYWMKLTDEQKNAKTPDEHTQSVVDYLNQENDYKEQMLDHTKGLQENLYKEIVARIKQTDMSVPYKKNGYYYLTRYEEGKEYPIHSRKKDNLDNEEEVMLNVNQLAEGHSYYAIGGRSVSPNNKILAYGEDTLSRRIYKVKFKNLETGELLEDEILNTTGGVVWANDNKTVFYTRKDDALRAFKIFKHKLGTPSSQDQEIYHEKDETFGTFVYKTKSKKYIVIGSYATLSNEYKYVNADTPDEDFTMFQPRERKLEYSIAHYNDKWYVTTNKDGAQNFKLMSCPEGQTRKENWSDVIGHRDDVLLEGMDIFKDYLVLSERKNGITQLRVRPWSGEEHYIEFPDDAYLAYTTTNPDFDTEILRLGYTSLTTPNSTYDYNMSSKAMNLLKQQEVVGGYEPNDYESERLMVKARDGAMVPVSLVYKKGFKKDGSSPILLYGYGSYGNSMDPYFSSVRLSLLDRGFGFAIAHIRGGQEMGRQWYEDGKFFNKTNTFKDFIDCGEYLVSNNYTAKENLYAMGGSAGGLLMGAIINMRPDLWNGVIAAVPFVDVVTTMLDESIPLTTGEYDEWGNPNDKAYYDYMKSYSPYDNVVKQEYPAMLVTTGYHDSQVQYWEPAKWVAKLRELKTNNKPLLMHCDMATGHGGASGRFKRYKETAMEYAFLLDLEGITK